MRTDAETQMLLETRKYNPLDPTSGGIPTVLRFMAGRVSGHDRRLLMCPSTSWLLAKLVFWTLKDDKDTNCVLAAERLLAERTGIESRSKIRSRLKLLARYGFIRVHAMYSKDCRRYRTSSIEVHPIVRACCRSRLGYRDRDLRAWCDKFSVIGLDRSNSDVDLQGFNGDVQYGLKEEGAASPPEQIQEDAGKWMGAGAQRLDVVALQKQQARRDNFDWHRKCRAFVAGCARTWQRAQIARHNNPDAQMPVWDGDLAKLDKENKQQYQTLARVFRNEGGARATIAWYLYCSAIPEKDAKGRVVFKPEWAHIQYAGPDKSPKAFARYFDSIMADPFIPTFKGDPVVQDFLDRAFGVEVINTPADGSKSSPLRLPEGVRNAATAQA